MKINLIFASDEDGLIGIDNSLPWHCKDDLRMFRRLTISHPVIMGKNTFASLGRPLDNRTNVVLSSSYHDKVCVRQDGVLECNSLKLALDHFRQAGAKEVWVAGGACLLGYAQPLADFCYHTEIEGSHSKVKGKHIFFHLDNHWIEEEVMPIRGGLVRLYRRLK